jgi:iron complex outermembrane recepter protein
VTFDYYHIKLDGAIGLHGTQYILNKCGATIDPNNAYCQLIHRDENGQITYIDDQRGNLTQTTTSGLDFAGRYVLPTPAVGRFTFTLDGTYLLQYDEKDQDGLVVKHAGHFDGDNYSMPNWKVNTGVGWDLKGWGATVTSRYVGSMTECSSGVCSQDNSEIRQVSSYMTFDLAGSYSLTSGFGKTMLQAGIQNVTDTKPPYLYTALSYNSDPQTYDFMGRFYFVRLTQSF